MDKEGGKACLLIRKHDHFTPAREIRRYGRALGPSPVNIPKNGSCNGTSRPQGILGKEGWEDEDVVDPDGVVLGYLAHKKQPPPRTLRRDYAQSPLMVLRGKAVSYERGAPVPSRPDQNVGVY